ncbi:MAG: hypothetical protein ACOYIT_01950 [Christensenellales bacterium]|jgi:hypothetical protein
MKRKQLFSIVMSLIMLLSIMAISLADSEEVINPDGTKTVTTTHDDGSVTTEVFYENGKLKSRTHEDEYNNINIWEYSEDGMLLSYSFKDVHNRYERKTIYEDGNPATKTEIYPDGYKKITTYDKNGNGEARDVGGNLIGGEKRNEDGTREEWSIDRFGSRNEHKYDKKGNILEYTHISPDGYKKITTYDKNGNSETNDADGNLIGRGTNNEDGTREEWSIDRFGSRNEHKYDKKGNILEYTHISPDGYKKITTYDKNGNGETHDGDGNLVGKEKQNEDGTREEWLIDRDGNINEYKYDKEWNIIEHTYISSEGYKSITTYDKNRNSETHDADGNLIGEEKRNEDGTRESWSIDRDGIRYENKYDKDYNLLERIVTKADGSQEITTIDENGNRITHDKDGNLLYTVAEEKEGYFTTKNAAGELLGEQYCDENGYIISSWEIDNQGNKVVFERDKEAKQNITRIYSPAGELIEETIRDFRNNIVSKKTFEAKVQKYVWHPSNTTSTHGFAFREERPELTDKWYRFTPLDLSQDGTTTIPLIGGGKYIIGSVTVEVSGDEVVVNYSYKGTPYDTARSESEYLNLLPNLADLETVEPEKLGEGFAFGEPISIENDLDGDTNVLLFVRNTLSFRDVWREDKQLAKYWPNSKNYAEYYEYLRGIMD